MRLIPNWADAVVGAETTATLLSIAPCELLTQASWQDRSRKSG
jgi:hypothetical protein